MNIIITNTLKNKFAKNPDELNELLSEFSKYKSNPNKEHFWFGKDEAYHTYKIAGKYILMHVHLVPSVDENALNEWYKTYDRNSNLKKGQAKRNKTSDICLIYVENSQNDFLLITIFDEPDAHINCENKNIMTSIKKIAEDFYCLGKVSD